MYAVSFYLKKIITKHTARSVRSKAFYKPLVIIINVILIITYMKKLLDSDWLRAVQLKSNTSAKTVIPVQITNQNS